MRILELRQSLSWTPFTLVSAAALFASPLGCGNEDNGEGTNANSINADSSLSGSNTSTAPGQTMSGGTPTGPVGTTGPADNTTSGAGGTGGPPTTSSDPASSGTGTGTTETDPGGVGGSAGTIGAGGVVGTAGTSGTADGGAAGSGNAGTPGGGGNGVAGAPVDDGPGDTGETMPSAGCGQAPPDSDRYSIDVDGLMREYILAVPENYDPEKAYRLIFAWHPWGGSAQQVAGNGPNGYYGLLGASDGEAILVSPEGLDFQGNGLGWGNTGGQDIDFLRAMLDRFDAELCFDHARLFSTGFSFGGMMSNAVACSGLARAVAPMAGNSVSGCAAGTQPVAYMGFHGDADSVVAISGGEAARDVFVERNGCGAVTPSDSDWCDLAGSNNQPCMCTTYEGCEAGYPVTWCQFSGNHTPAPNSGETIWNFFSQF